MVTMNSLMPAKQQALAYSNSMVGTGYLAYRDLEILIKDYVRGKNVLDYGCGRGRSSRFLSSLGFEVDAIDTCSHMVEQAKKQCKKIRYRPVEAFQANYPANSFDFILAQLVLVEIRNKWDLKAMLKEQFEALKPGGILIHTTVSDDFLKHSWSTIDTDYPGNEKIKNGQAGRIKLINRNLELDSFCWQEAFLRSSFKKTGFEVLILHRPLGHNNDPYQWGSEATESPYFVFVLKRV